MLKISILKKYFVNVLVSIDQLANTLFGGDPDETISSRAGKMAQESRKRFPYYLCTLLHWFDKDHCKKSIEEDEGKDGVIK